MHNTAPVKGCNRVIIELTTIHLHWEGFTALILNKADATEDTSSYIFAQKLLDLVQMQTKVIPLTTSTGDVSPAQLMVK